MTTINVCWSNRSCRYALSYLFCTGLNLLNVVVSIFLLDRFIGEVVPCFLSISFVLCSPPVCVVPEFIFQFSFIHSKVWSWLPQFQGPATFRSLDLAGWTLFAMTMTQWQRTAGIKLTPSWQPYFPGTFYEGFFSSFCCCFMFRIFCALINVIWEESSIVSTSYIIIIKKLQMIGCNERQLNGDLGDEMADGGWQWMETNINGWKMMTMDKMVE